MQRSPIDSPDLLDPAPVVHELSPAPDPEDVLTRLAGRPYCLFLDSALAHPVLGRWSFVAVDPFEMIRVPVDGSDGLARLAERLAAFPVASLPEMPPFQGGAAGLFSYDLGRCLERLPAPRFDEFGAPAMAVGLYDVVIAFDHAIDRAWIISQGLPEIERDRRQRRAAARLKEMFGWLSGDSEPRAKRESPLPPVPAANLCPQFSVPGPAGLTSNFSEPMYLDAVQRAIDYIFAGDLFQVNIAQRLLFPAHDDALSLYLRLRRRNAATFAGYFDLGDFQICSASPERFVQVHDRQVEARPIKGTRQRTARPEADLYAGAELRASEKDRAENVMIVDLLRNDLARVCTPESVRVTQLCQLESYAYVQHLVSAVEGRLRNDVSAVDLVRAAFPGGSITGAPKIRAMEIIAELERVARGAYCGGLGYVGFDGEVDMSILIRTITAGRGWWQLPVGGGIVAQSHPPAEYEETWHKAEGLVRALLP